MRANVNDFDLHTPDYPKGRNTKHAVAWLFLIVVVFAALTVSVIYIYKSYQIKATAQYDMGEVAGRNSGYTEGYEAGYKVGIESKDEIKPNTDGKSEFEKRIEALGGNVETEVMAPSACALETANVWKGEYDKANTALGITKNQLERMEAQQGYIVYIIGGLVMALILALSWCVVLTKRK